jgi:hypothetical protein
VTSRLQIHGLGSAFQLQSMMSQVLLALPLGFALRPKIPECPNRVCSCQVAKGVRGLATILTLHLAASTGQYPVA